MTWRFLLYLWLCPTMAISQQIVDSCFLSISPGRYEGSGDIENTCFKCSPRGYASDMMEWDPVNFSWIGKLPNNPTVDLPPPVSNCLTRAIWIGSPAWTPEGEGVALRLDKPLEAGKTYSYTFTYAADGAYSEQGFAPVVFTNSSYRIFENTHAVDTLPRVSNAWETHVLTFTATAGQNGHTWLILFGYDGSGTLLSNCKQNNPFPQELFPEDDTLLCVGDVITLSVQSGSNITQEWNDFSTESSLTVDDPGIYSVEARYFHCNRHDTITVLQRDCHVVMHMPNVFTPNDDEYNNLFIPLESNYVKDGLVTILNRWGQLLFRGDVFTGWDGTTSGKNASAGVYYYKVDFRDEKDRLYQRQGIVSLLR